MEGLWGALIGAAVGFLSAILTLWLGRRQLYVTAVSENRMAWINIWRENLARMLACAELLNNRQCCSTCTSDHSSNGSCASLLQAEREFLEARGMLSTRLNLAESNHKAMLLLLNDLDYRADREEFLRRREAILALGRKILKPEWERIKKEA